MTLFMLLMQQLLPKWQKYALPPERITTELAKRAEVGKFMNKPQRVGIALITHFGYGSNMGMFYEPLSRRVNLPPALKGAIFGMLVWVGSYFGIAPTMKLSDAAPNQPLQRNIMMIGAHLIWGTTLGIAEDFLERVK
jgi:putative membrane protein